MKYRFITYFLLISVAGYSQGTAYQTVSVERISLTRAIFTGKVFASHREDKEIEANYFASDLSEFKRSSPPPIEYLLRIEAQRKFYTELLDQSCQSFKNEKEASTFFSKIGWDYLAEGDRAEAQKRFDWAYLLDGQNTDAFWGLGVMTFQEGNLVESTLFMEQGLKASENKNVTLMVDLATVYTKLYTQSEQRQHLVRATELLDKAIDIQPNFAHAYMQKATVELINGDAGAAWENFHKGYEISPNDSDDNILAALLAEKPDPKRLFFR